MKMTNDLDEVDICFVQFSFSSHALIFLLHLYIGYFPNRMLFLFACRTYCSDPYKVRSVVHSRNTIGENKVMSQISTPVVPPINFGWLSRWLLPSGKVAASLEHFLVSHVLWR